jgi:hypothetical protein
MNTVSFGIKIFSFSFVLCFSVSGVFLFSCVRFSLIGCAGSVGTSLAGWVMYIFRVSLCCVEWRAGSVLFDRCGGVGDGTLQIFLLLCLCSGGYSTVEMVRGGGWSVFPLLSSVCCQLSWRLGLCGRYLCVIMFCW